MAFLIISGEIVIFPNFNTAQKSKFSIKDFFSKCDQIHSLLRIWSHLLKKSLMENFIFFVQYKWVLGKKERVHYQLTTTTFQIKVF